jgi:hypothetical protein
MKVFLLFPILLLAAACSRPGNGEHNSLYRPGTVHRYRIDSVGDSLQRSTWITLHVVPDTAPVLTYTLGREATTEALWRVDSTTGSRTSAPASFRTLVVDNASEYELSLPEELMPFLKNTASMHVDTASADTLVRFTSIGLDSKDSRRLTVKRSVKKKETLETPSGSLSGLIRTTALYISGSDSIHHVYYFHKVRGFVYSEYRLGDGSRVQATLIP